MPVNAQHKPSKNEKNLNFFYNRSPSGSPATTNLPQIGGSCPCWSHAKQTQY